MTEYLSDEERSWWSRHPDSREDEDPLAHDKLHHVMQALKDNQSSRKQDFLLYGAMYYGAMPSSWAGGWADGYAASTPSNRGNISLNVSRSAVDAVWSRIAAKAKPHLSYVTEGGDYEKQHNAEALEAGVSGVFYQTNFYNYALDGFRDGCVFGTGRTRIYPDKKGRKVRVIRYLPWDVIYDDGEIQYQDGSMSLYTQWYEDRARLAWQYSDEPDKAALIERLSLDRTEDAERTYKSAALRICVEEAWRKPSGKGAGDGRHVVGVRNCTLIDEPWDGDRFDFASFSWSKGLIGEYGQGLVEQGAEIQAEINRIMRDIRNGMHLIKGHYLVESGSKVLVSHLNNDLTAILKYTGAQPPIYQAPAIIAPEVYQHLWNLKQQYYELAKLNEQTISATKPVGITSGEAQRVYADQQTETLLEKGMRYEEYVRDCGDLVTRAAKALAKSGAYEVRSMNDDGFQTIDWRELDEPDGYESQIAPTSSLPGTISGKIDLAYDLDKLGDFDSVDIMEIVGMPDMLQKTRMKLSSRKLVEKRVGLMLREGKPWQPHSLLNLQEAIVIARDMHNLAEEKDVEDSRLQLVRDFIAACVEQLSQAPAPAPQAIGPSGNALLGPGAPPPVPLGGQAAPPPSPEQKAA